MNSNETYYQTVLSQKELIDGILHNTSFEQVTFQLCNFQGLTFVECSFIDCTFEKCNLSLIQAKKTNFVNVNFNDCKVVGVNWTKIKGNLGISLSFQRCVLNYSTFVEISFLKSKLYHCDIKNADFFNSDLRKCDCRKSDFQNTNFSNTNLQETDFREAINYFINIFENQKNLKGAQFSTGEVQNLLQSLDIVIE